MVERKKMAVLALAAFALSGTTEPDDDPDPDPDPIPDPTPTPTHEIEICETDGNRVDYKLVANNLEPVSGTLEEDERRTADNAYEGRVWGACDSFEFTGDTPTNLDLSGSTVEVTIDGSPVDLDDAGWVTLPSGPGPGDAPSGPSDPTYWELVFEDNFEGNSLDLSKWKIGFGWGVNANYAKSTSHASATNVRNGKLVCEFQHRNGQYRHGAVATQGKHFWSPPVVFETRMRASNLPGSNQAFWSKPNSEAWPPEIDFVEVPTKRMRNSMHHVHTSSNCGVNGGDVDTNNGTYGAGPDRHQAFYTYTCRWLPGSVTHWVDGNHVGTANLNGCQRSSLNAGAPFYIMCNNVMGNDGGWMGNTPHHSNWGPYKLTTEFEYVRVWKNSR